MLLQKERKAIEDIASENKKKAHEKAKASGNLANFKAGLQGSEVSETIAAVKKWEEVIMRTNEAYVVAETCEEAFLKVRRDCVEIASRFHRDGHWLMTSECNTHCPVILNTFVADCLPHQVAKKLVVESARDDDEATLMVKDISSLGFKDPIDFYESAQGYAGRFSDNAHMGEQCVPDLLRARISMQQGQQIKDIVVRLAGSMSLSEEAIEPIKPSLRVAAPVDEDAEVR